MKAKKKHRERKNAVLIVGAGYGSLKVAEDLAQSGIPVVWVTKAQHFLELPNGEYEFNELPEDLNYQFRPLYLRVTRHPLVTPLTRARIISVEKDTNGLKSTITQDPHYIDYDICTGCGKCMEICPLNESDHPPISRTPAYCPSKALEIDKRSISVCRIDCPLNVNVQAYMALTAESRFEEALEVIRETNPLPGICGRICHHPCEANCRRNELDQPIAIRTIKRFLADYEADNGDQPLMKDKPVRPEKVAIVGSGPAGLTAAHFLNKNGFKITVYESLNEAGGMLRAGINSFRLPRKILDKEIEVIEKAGVSIRTGEKIDSAEKLLNDGYDAVLLSIGTHSDLNLNIPGEDLNGVLHCLEFLYSVNFKSKCSVGERVVVIGAGNSAMDAARTSLRLGAKKVTILGIEKEDEMPAHPAEVLEAREEGVNFVLGAAPISFEGDKKVSAITCRKAHWEFSNDNKPPELIFDSTDTFTIQADTVIVSIGQKPAISGSGIGEELETGPGDKIIINDNYSTTRKGIFAAGDIVTGPSTVVESMASGKKAADKIINFLTGKSAPEEKHRIDKRGIGDYIDISDKIPKQKRSELAQRQPRVRKKDFDEVDLGYSIEQAVAEARRCLQCGSCCECRICESACTDIGAIDHFKKPRQLKLNSPSIIVADDNEVSNIDLEKFKDIYRITDVYKQNDLLSLMLAGSSSAGRLMANASELRELTLPDKVTKVESSKEHAIGVFFCTCNNTMASEDILDYLQNMVRKMPGVKHSELIFSACHPKGSGRIAKSFVKHKLNRAIVASCVCCPLEFACISCNDQRTRPRIYLFDQLGMERSQFEMINLKDAINAGEFTKEEKIRKARDLLRTAFIKSNYLTGLRQGYTKIGNKIVILGGSEIGINCALNLELQGFRVRLVHKCRLIDDKEYPKKINNRDIDISKNNKIEHIEEAVIEEIYGHIGDYTIVYNVNGKRGRWQADMICLTDLNMLPLAINEDMMGLKKLYRYNFSFFHTPQPGLYRVLPRTLKRMNEPGIGTALAAQVAKAYIETFLKDHELSPRIDPERCRGCGRCADICPFDAIKMTAGPDGIYHSELLRHNCVGCGGCVGRCPVTAMDMPYFSNRILDEVVIENLTRGGRYGKS